MKQQGVLSFAPLAVCFVIAAIWEGLCAYGFFSPYLVASPIEIFICLANDWRELLYGLCMTAICAVGGFCFSVWMGTLFAVMMISWNWAYRAFYPLAVIFQTVPIIAVAPLLVIWFGYGFPTVMSAAFLASIFPVIMATLTGLETASPQLRDLFTLYGASKRDRLFKLLFPMALPTLATGLRIAAGLAVIGTIVGEFVGGGGLGSVIDSARAQQRLDRVFAAVGLASLLGALAISVIDRLNRFAMRYWSPEGEI